MPIANEDVGFRARGPRNQYVPPITEENLRDNAYTTMKKGGRVGMPRIKKVKKKGKATATATAIVNVYTGKRGRTVPAQPRPPKPPQPINVSVQIPNYMSSFDPRIRPPPEPFQNIRFSENIEQPIRMAKTEEPFKQSEAPLSNLTPLSKSGLINKGLPMKEQGEYEPIYLINTGEPIRLQEAYEPYDPIEMKHEKEPDELIIMEQDLQPIIRRRRTKEEMEQARQEGEIRRVELRHERLETLMKRLSEEREQKPDSPFIKQMEREIQKLMKR